MLSLLELPGLSALPMLMAPTEVDVLSLEPFSAIALCRAIAESDKRIAAILIGPVVKAHPLVFDRYLQRVRELASAEGALLLWCGPAGSVPSVADRGVES